MLHCSLDTVCVSVRYQPIFAQAILVYLRPVTSHLMTGGGRFSEIVDLPSLSVPFHPLPFPSLLLRCMPTEIQLGVWGLLGSAVTPLQRWSPSQNRILCILALKYDICWQQF